MDKKKLVIFDFDGVLVDTLLVCYSISSEVNENLSLDEYRDFFFGNIYSAKRINGVKNKHPKVWEIYAEKTRELKVPSIIKESIKKLAEQYILTVVSSTNSDLIEKILNREECNLFSDLLGADFHSSKVEKNNFLLQKYGVLPEEAVFITDTVGDIVEARESGIKSIAVSWGFHDRDRLEKGSPESIIDNPEDLIPAIEKILC